jgi:hypothetical protein
MSPPVRTNCILSPETVALATAAFDSVCSSVPHPINGNEDMTQTLALIILRHIDRGERDPQRLADVALREWTGSARSATG